MPDGLTARHSSRGGWLRDAALVLVIFAVGGTLGGLVWHQLWSPASGVVLGGVWYPEPDQGFSGTGLFVLVGVGAGVLLGALSALLADRRELLTLLLVVGGSVLATWIMLQVGMIDTPPDPERLAPQTEDYARLPSSLVVTGLSPLVALPSGALAGLCVTFMGLSRKPVEERREADLPG